TKTVCLQDCDASGSLGCEGHCGLDCQSSGTCEFASAICGDVCGTTTTTTTTTSTSSTTTTTCAPGLTSCPPDGCVDLQTSFAHCGSCGVPCGSFEYCCNGGCLDTGDACGPPTTTTTTLACVPDCNHDCAADGCGGFCGRCAPCHVCMAGSCAMLQNTAPCEGGQCCTGMCIDTGSDNMNCGACGATCIAPQTCGGGGPPGICGRTPATASPLGQHCGTAPDGCGGSLNGGPCIAPDTCGGGGTPGMCGCMRATSCPMGQNCGTAPDGCGGTVNCGTCAPGQGCCNGVGGGHPTCTPLDTTSNCGMCGRVCQQSPQGDPPCCSAGSCGLLCPGPNGCQVA